ncbi:LLM class flavin-dependent oxidoreductase [Minwuia thermotolerans]|uniref:LLM class flavin-dependent oxidoreductase n=1 Tax=Minwuia thermotolerans TaxID=2056226 RepID=A0A2M9G518_9PROT|nr:LLM class flavin-dependent oxidoreductase [Minwuia thermotolerans]PJK30801.1 LLM class flavin-dependent oxidoreductase [Minwuia thermotolerans]
MHVGMTTFFQNKIEGMSDREVWAHEVGMAERAEPMGFQSVWSAEHHFDDYTMCPNVAQFLTYMAGRTKHVRLGSMVMVLPWHDPVRIAEEVSVLDHVSNGRAILGVGRGLGRIEFEGFRREMGHSREHFVEYAEAILESLETGVIRYDGKHYKQPAKEIRPAPFQTFKGRTYASAVSPESARIMARLGIGVMIIAQKPWDKTVEELNMYREIYREENNGAEAPRPLVACFTATHPDASVADEMHEKYIRGYSRSALEHYEFHNEGLADIKGYEYYGGLAKNIKKHGVDAFCNFLADLQVWGTPDAVYEKMREYQDLTDCAGFMCSFSYGGMPHEMARENMKCFADTVLPRLKELEIGGEVDALRMAA